MATVIVHPADLGAARLVHIDRRLVHFGSAADNDVVLDGGGATPHHAHILFERGTFTIASTDAKADVVINGKRRKSHKLSDGDVVVLGQHLLRFSLYDQGLVPPGREASFEGEAAYFRAFHRFANRLMNAYEVPKLLETLLDELIDISGADKAFLLLIEDGAGRVRVARNVDRQTLEEQDVAVSDTIVGRVLETGEPLIVADALTHEDFKSSHSVVNLKLCSVMCVPLKARGQTLGLFYLGNDNVVNHFTTDLLEIIALFASTAAQILSNALAREELLAHVADLETAAADRRFGEIIGACDAMREIYKKISRVATTDISVLIEGETGTGKELVARAVHQRSNRAKQPFVVLNCGAIPENLLESELFGHVRGAFTGAVSTQQGKFQAAAGGTLFLDEVGEMPLSLQVKILRAIQEKTVIKVGDTRPEQVDIRIVAATNKRLADEVKTGRFREDLYYRLNVITLDLPPLRERGEDIVLIARYLLARFGPELGGREAVLSADAIRALRRWRWPGNIRELENRVKKAIVFCDSGVIQPADLDLDDAQLEPILPLSEAREQWQREYINTVLALHDGNRTQTARVLDVDPRTIFRHLERERDEA
ncbi:MAG: sigma 54-interacting transcriptional regulator [Deltaproteobacteria bacterium]|nr:sigma 54-interacting transcriptional regulator [Deltaproteobacteria bacterium]MCB9786414.1 sigma 54-interacting transcriptional regulator [Deltaproteobacteria bacterium]